MREGGGGFHDTYTHKNQQIWYMSSHMCSNTHTHTHFNVGTSTVGLPSVQACIGGGGGGSFLSSQIFHRGGGWDLRTAWGLGECSFFLFHGCILSCTWNTMKTRFEVASVPCYVVQGCVVVCCDLVRCEVVSFGVVWGVVLCCVEVGFCVPFAVACCNVRWSIMCGHMRCSVVCWVVMGCGLVSCGVVRCVVMGCHAIGLTVSLVEWWIGRYSICLVAWLGCLASWAI